MYQTFLYVPECDRHTFHLEDDRNCKKASNGKTNFLTSQPGGV